MQEIDAKDLKIKLKFKNYKLLKDEEFTLEGSYVYLIGGGNERGKTSMMEAIIMLMNAKNLTPKAVTNGEDHCHVEGTIPGPGGNYQTRVDISKDGDSSFIMFKPDGSKVKKVTDIRSVFEYNNSTVDDFIRDSYTAVGRRNQMKILADLLPEVDKNEFHKLRVSTVTGGDLFETRKDATASLNTKKALLEASKVSEEELESFESNKEAPELLVTAEEEYLTLTKIPTKETNINLINQSKNPAIDALHLKITNDNEAQNTDDAEIIRVENEIARLQGELMKLNNRKRHDSIKKDKEELQNLIVSRDNLILAIPDDKVLLEDTEKALQKKNMLTEAIQSSAIIQEKINKRKEIAKEVTVLREDLEAKELALTTGRKRIDELIKAINVPGYDISIVDNAIHIDGFVLNEHQISDSKMTIAVTAILAQATTKAKILCVGKLAELDKSSLNQLVQIAKDNNLVIVGDKVDHEVNDIYVEGFQSESIDHTIIKETIEKEEAEVIENLNKSQITKGRDL